MTDLKERLLQFLQDAARHPQSFSELNSALSLDKAAEAGLRAVLEEMEREGLVVRTRHDRYGVPERMNLITGNFQGHGRGFAFVVPLQPDQEDLFIPPEAMGGALHGDRVVARRGGRTSSRGQPEGEVIRVLRRANRRVVGTLEKERGFGFVSPDERRIPHTIFIPGSSLKKARSGEKVVVEITRWPEGRRGPEGRVVERLGKATDPGVDILSVIHRFGLPTDFPAPAIKGARRVPQEVQPEDIRDRRDLRGLLTVTIDGEDARDLDDAVSLEIVTKGPVRRRLGVHIADVSHYVTEGSKLDAEARDRATSVYLVDRVIPMLPHELSNGICSLNPGVDRLSMSVFIDFDGEGRAVGYEITPSVIRSRARLTYDAVWSVIGEGRSLPADAPAVVMAASEDEAGRLPELLSGMKELAATLRRRRMERGSIDFDLPEPKVVLDGQGKAVEIRRAERNFAHQLIEEFMLAANETVAAHCARLKAPLIYRIHEPPAEEKVDALRDLLGALGVKFPAGDLRPRAFQNVLKQVSGHLEEALVSAVLLRTMKQARYADENRGHFGLASENYCHFTSPIRRYPDLVVHRVLKELKRRGGIRGRLGEGMRKAFPGIADQASLQERVAAEAEMETVKIKMAEYMSGRVGETFAGIISGVTAFGVFVQLENLVEGLVHVTNMKDDYYRFDERAFALIGERGGRRLRLGDPIEVKVSRVAAAERNIDFVMI